MFKSKVNFLGYSVIHQRYKKANSPSGRITVIFPFRYSVDRADAFDRIKLALSRIKNRNISVMVVDSGSEDDKAKIVQSLCQKHSAEYVYIDTKNELFSIGLARDVGVLCAHS